MARKINYKPVSKELEIMSKPSPAPSTRTSVGLDQVVGEYYFIDVNQLRPFRNQARKSFDEEEITKLADSIKEYGIRQPLTVIKGESRLYEVVSGERRLRAAKRAGLDKVPCIILKDPKDSNSIALIENIHREDLHPIELGSMYKKLIEEKAFKNQDVLASSISVPKSVVSEYIKFANLPEEVRSSAIKQNITRDKLRALVKFHESQGNQKVFSAKTLDSTLQDSFSIARINLSRGEIKVQDSGISKLSKQSLQEVKKYLQHLIHKIDNM